METKTQKSLDNKTCADCACVCTFVGSSAMPNVRWCDTCECSVPENSWRQHERGKRHNTLRFYGANAHANTIVGNVVQRNAIGEVVRTLRPHEVSDAVATFFRRMREIALVDLVAHTGVAHFDQALTSFRPEKMLPAVIGMVQKERDNRAAGVPVERLETESIILDGYDKMSTQANASLEPDYVQAAIAAALVVHNNLTGSPAPPLRQVGLNLYARTGMGHVHDLREEMVLSTALGAFARAIGGAQGKRSALRVALNMGGRLRERRLVALLVHRLAASLAKATMLAQLDLRAAPGVLRSEDLARLEEAAARSWHARERTVLMGTHVRSSGSPFRLLPAALVRQVLDLVAEESRCRVVFAVESPLGFDPIDADVVENPPIPTLLMLGQGFPQQMQQGGDMGFIAEMLQ